MKVVILAGGFGTRLSEETDLKPKPMVNIGDKPILWHIMKIYAHYGFNEFIICLGYKGYVIKEFFHNYFLHSSDVTIDLANNNHIYHNQKSENWKVTLVDTGQETMTGGRIRRIQSYVNDETFFLTYGDGVADINLQELLKFHNETGKKLTLTAVQPDAKYGVLDISKESLVEEFKEKPKSEGGWVNGGFMVCEPEVFSYLKNGDRTVFEWDPLSTLAQEKQLAAYKHFGFWRCMDTLRDKQNLTAMWENQKAAWKIW